VTTKTSTLTVKGSNAQPVLSLEQQQMMKPSTTLMSQHANPKKYF
jgi:hypothetical protein